MAHRISLGRFGTFALGPPVHLGRRKKTRGLGRIDEFGPARGVTIFVGRNKGKQPQNRTGTCRLAPKKFSVAAIDAEFIKLRGAQVGKKALRATRGQARRYYKDDAEDIVTYEVAFIPSAWEPTFKVFRRHMDALAKGIAGDLSQNSVVILRDDGRRRSLAQTVWEPPPRRRRRR